MEENDTNDVYLKMWRYFLESIGMILTGLHYPIFLSFALSSLASSHSLLPRLISSCVALSQRISTWEPQIRALLIELSTQKSGRRTSWHMCSPFWASTSRLHIRLRYAMVLFSVLSLLCSNTRSCPLEPKMLNKNSCAVENITSYLGEKKQSHFSELPEIDLSDSKVSRFRAIKAPSDFYFSANLNSRSQISISKFHHK